jgi:esterase/lipase superfamily enzyme
LIVAAALMTGCVNHATLRSRLPGATPVSKEVSLKTVSFIDVNVLYATDRARQSSDTRAPYGAERGAKVEYGVATISVPKGHEVGKTERPPTFLGIRVRPEDRKRDIVLVDTKLITLDELLSKLNPTGPNNRAVLLFVHGFNVSFEDAARNTGQLAVDLKFPGQVMFFSWPASARSLGNQLLGYHVDTNNAMVAASHLAQLLEDIDRRSGAQHIVVIAHSMGNLVLSLALQTAYINDPSLKGKLAHVIMAAPDLDADAFRETFAPAVIRSAGDVTMYASATDKALQESAHINGHQRAGDAIGGPIVLPPMETVDATTVDTDFLGHSYVSDSSSVLVDSP